MKYLALTVIIPKHKAPQFARSLVGSARAIGASLTKQFNEGYDDQSDCATITFLFAAQPVLTPEQITALMALCQIYSASIVTLHFDEGDEGDEDESAEHEPPQPTTRHLELVVDNTSDHRKP